MYKVILTEKVDTDLNNIFSYIAEDNEKKAHSFIDEMLNYCLEKLKEIPLSFQKVKGDVRRLNYGRYGFLYIVDEKNKIVEVLHIFAGGQDWEEWV